MVFRLAPVIIASLVVGAFVAPGASAYNVSTAAGHAAEDAVVPTAAQEQALDAHTLAVSAAGATAAAAVVSTNPHSVGRWGPVVNWPVVAIHAALLPNGKVLAYDSIGDNATESYPTEQQNHTRATVWNPATGSQSPVDETGFNIFCSGLAHLFDGRLFIAGGNKDPALDGIRETHIFDPATNTWSLGPEMAAGRWYPTVTPLRNGEMLISSGRDARTDTDPLGINKTPEVYTPGTNSLRELTGAALELPLYPWIDVGPDGRAFYSGPDQFMKKFDTAGPGAWQYVGDRDTINRDYGGHALFDIGKELVAGGGPSTPDAEVIDLNGATPDVKSTAPMAFGRRQHNLTVLADGTVLATGGNSSGAPLVDLNAGVYNAEQWKPATGQWRTLAAEQVTRQYHSTALLLPDGRVLSAGGGVCGICDQIGYLAKNAQIFWPPYLFQADGSLAPRPTIASAPTSTGYGSRFRIGTADPASIKKVALIRLGAVTHSDNMDQRYVPLSFSAGATDLTAAAPANANIAPPGVYMLVIVDSNGMPSVARTVGVGNSPLDTTPPTVSSVVPADGATNVQGRGAVSATFSEAINPTTVTASSFTVHDASGNAVAATVSSSGSTVTLTPSAPLAGRTTYTATLAGGSGGIEDLAGNSLAADDAWSFTTGDMTPPTAGLAFPTGSGAYSAAGWTAGCLPAGFCGTASDDDSGVQVVELSIQRGTGRYWNGTGFGSTTERWLPASGTTAWSYAFPTFPAEGTYTVRVRATDNAGNRSTPTAATFVYDATAPNLGVTFPVAAAAYTTATWDVGCPAAGICGTADDGGSGVSQVEISIRRGTGSYWDGTSFGSPTEVFFTTTGTTTWSFPFPASSFGQKAATYTIRVRATDGVGNVRGPTGTRFSFTP
jgi:hypothetical protein